MPEILLDEAYLIESYNKNIAFYDTKKVFCQKNKKILRKFGIVSKNLLIF